VELWILALEALQLALVAASLLEDFAECVSLVRCAWHCRWAEPGFELSIKLWVEATQLVRAAEKWGLAAPVTVVRNFYAEIF